MPLPIIPRRGWNSCNALPNNHQVSSSSIAVPKVIRSVPHYKTKKCEQLSSSNPALPSEDPQLDSMQCQQLQVNNVGLKRDSNHNLWHHRRQLGKQVVHKMDQHQLQKLYLKNAIVTTTGHHHHHHHRSSIIKATAASPTVIKVAHRGP